jgi:hypothetical protein
VARLVLKDDTAEPVYQLARFEGPKAGR